MSFVYRIVLEIITKSYTLLVYDVRLANRRKSPTWSSHDTSEIAVFFGRGEVSPTYAAELTFTGRIVGKTPRIIASYNLLKEVRITVCCGNQQKAVTSTLNIITQRTTSTKASRSCMTVQICVYS